MSERAWHFFPLASLADSRRTFFTSAYSAGEHIFWYTGSRRTRSIRQVSFQIWWVTTEVRCGLVAVQGRPDVAQERTTKILLAHRRLPYLELPLKV